MGPPQLQSLGGNSLGGISQLEWHARSLGAAANQENNMLKEALEKLISLGDPVFRQEDDGRVYSSRQTFAIQKPVVEPIRLQTLSGLRDVFKLYEQVDPKGNPMIQIHDYQRISIISKTVDEWLRRSVHAVAELPNDSPKFRFGTWMDPEEFVIGLMTLFEDATYISTDHRKVVKLVNNLAAEAVTISNDDGLSQQVVTKQGLVMKGEEKVAPRVNLSPYRTFREVSQPTSDFILRLRSRQGQMPSCALFEADGGQWKNTAIQYIKEYFAKELPEANVVA